MKKRGTSLLTILILTFFSNCKSDDIAPEENQILGTWNLKEVSGGYPDGINYFGHLQYEDGEILWHFSTGNLLIVENNLETDGPKQASIGIIEGTYHYEIRDEHGSKFLLIDNLERGKIAISKVNTLELDEGVGADGFLRLFKK